MNNYFRGYIILRKKINKNYIDSIIIILLDSYEDDVCTSRVFAVFANLAKLSE